MKTLQTIAMPADLNPYGMVFGGWIMGQLDLAGAIAARQIARAVVTVAADKIEFCAPLWPGDVISCEAQIIATGRTSIRVAVQMSATRRKDASSAQIARGELVYVSVDEHGQKSPIA